MDKNHILYGFIRFFFVSLFAVIVNVNQSKAQCACLYYDVNGDFTCILYGNCSGPNLTNCSNQITSSTVFLCNPGACPQHPSMNWNCGGCLSNHACWYNGTACEASDACQLIGDILTLPVRIADFSVRLSDEGNIITWTTESEFNSDYFLLYYSADGQNFEELMMYPGGGNSSTTINYSTTHVDPSLSINYYKLIQVDFNGETTSYGPISIDNRDLKRELVKVCNLLGQEVNANYRGIVIYHYSDGTYEKIYR